MIAQMPRVYFYKLTVDSGAAPCVKNGILSLAICKPTIRATAQVGDLIFGFAANSLYSDNRLIYAARVTQALHEGRYFVDERYASRDDCIYYLKQGRFQRRKDAKFHDKPTDLRHDLGDFPDYLRANVLLSNDFRYFGNAATDIYKARFPTVASAVTELGRGQRVRLEPALRLEFEKMKNWIWIRTPQKVVGRPSNASRPGVCHRTKSCHMV
ncbi:hypothetical protein ABIF79_010038 [Bradyrhizobium japonicum]